MIDLNIPYSQFLYDLSGAGFEYENTLINNNYTDYVDLTSVVKRNIPLSGDLVIDDATNSNARIYERVENVTRILNYDQLLNRNSTRKVFGRVDYKNAYGREVYTPAVISAFNFGEIKTDPVKELNINFSLTRGSNVWISKKPIVATFESSGSDEAHFHRFSHPWTHGMSFQAGQGTIAAIGGTDFGRTVIYLNGELSPFTLTIKSANGLYDKKIVYNNHIGTNDTVTIDSINLFARRNGRNDIANFDLEHGDSPFLNLMPNTTYELYLDADVLRGNVIVEIYETWVSVP